MPIISWFNSDTMTASTPIDTRGAEAPVNISRFKFIVPEQRHEILLKEALPEEMHEHVQLVLED